MPGGCKLGARPIDQHIKGFEALGANVDVGKGTIKAHANKLTGTSIYMDITSVGATINVMIFFITYFICCLYSQGQLILARLLKILRPASPVGSELLQGACYG